MNAERAAFHAVQSALQSGSPAGDRLVLVSWVLIVGAVVVFAITMAALAWALRRRGDGRATHDRRWLFGAGIAFPAIVLAALYAWITWGSGTLSPPHDAQAMVVKVTGRSWWWDVEYRDPRTGAAVRTANQIHLPAGRAVTLALTADDVIHSFWVPALAGKVDMLPGRIHHLRVSARDLGTWRGQCAEFCGEQHARMALHVVVQGEADFDRWLEAQARDARTTDADPRFARGRAVFDTARCAACHHVRGGVGASRLGPDLTHLGSRIALGAGTLPNSEASIRLWLTDLQRHKPGARMPSYDRLDAESLDALAHYLWRLQ